ncbi:MAG: HK97 family phage prohead protease [Holosporales bacterium]|jgi:HK97 family phage prohead protease|nr:HK97 family phage prohead protease [Holosporales bacterium]
MQFLNYPMHIKSMDQTGVLEGYASVFSTVDLQNEIVQPGAFQKSLAMWQESSNFPKMLWQHDPTSPIGIWEHMAEDQYGLYVRGRLLLDVQKGREAHSLLQSGAIDGLSIGFVSKQAHMNGKVRVLEEIDLFEVSLVTFMANPLAKVTVCKHWTDSYEQTIGFMNRLKSLKKAMDRAEWRVKSLILEHS